MEPESNNELNLIVQKLRQFDRGTCDTCCIPVLATRPYYQLRECPEIIFCSEKCFQDWQQGDDCLKGMAVRKIEEKSNENS